MVRVPFRGLNRSDCEENGGAAVWTRSIRLDIAALSAKRRTSAAVKERVFNEELGAVFAVQLNKLEPGEAVRILRRRLNWLWHFVFPPFAW